MASVSLAKGNKVSLTKLAEGRKLSTLSFGLGWTPKGRGIFGMGRSQDIDLDASCAVTRDGRIVDAVYFGSRGLRSLDGFIRHSGDDRSGRGGFTGVKDNEIITVDADRLPVDTILVFTVNSFSGERFSQLAEAYIRITDDATNQELARFSLTGFGDYTGLIVGGLRIKQGDYEFQAIEKVANGRTVGDLRGVILDVLHGS